MLVSSTVVGENYIFLKYKKQEIQSSENICKGRGRTDRCFKEVVGFFHSPNYLGSEDMGPWNL